MTVRATVRGHEGMFLWDTGEGVSMISPAFAQRVGCTPWGQVTGYRMTGERIDAPHCDELAFDVTGVHLVAPSVIVFDIMSIVDKPDAPQLVRFTLGGSVPVEGTRRMLDHMAIDGNLGVTFLRNWDVTLDLASGRAWLTAASRP